jgi:phage-related protein
MHSRTKKRAIFLGDTKRAISAFPRDVRREAGYQLDFVQDGFEPTDWKPLPAIGSGVREIRIRERSGAFRVICQAALADVVLVLSAFQKKSQKTPLHEIETARDRLNEYLKTRGLK